MKKIFLKICIFMFVCCVCMYAQTKPRNSDEAWVEETLNRSTGVNKSNESSTKENTFSRKAIAIPTPTFDNVTSADAWMPQFIQDSLTNNFARLSNMRVVDRRNEQLAIAEQKLGESGFYDFDSAAQIGQMTNAEYLLAGNIQKLRDSYSMSFRVNNITTNEIAASFSGRYSVAEIENGVAVRDAVVELFAGLGIPLTDSQINSITADKKKNDAVKKLAEGNAYEKADDYFVAISMYIESGEEEASQNVQRILDDNIPNSIKERAAYYNNQQKKWQKIFDGLREYMHDGEHLPIFIYDFSVATDKISANLKQFDYIISKGIKVIPNRTALMVYDKIQKAWNEIKSKPENKTWTRNLNFPSFIDGIYYVEFELLDEYGDQIATTAFRYNLQLYPNSTDSRLNKGTAGIDRRILGQTVKAQMKYFNEEKFSEIEFNKVPIGSATDTMSCRVAGVYEGMKSSFTKNEKKQFKNPMIMTVDEFNLFCELTK